MIAAVVLFASLVTADNDGLVVHYSFDAGQGDRLIDRVGNRHGSIDGATWQQTALGHGLRFDGQDDHVSLGSDPGLKLAGSFTIELWVRHDSVDGWQDYVGNYIGGQSGVAIAQSDGSLYFHHGGLEPYTLETGVLLRAGVWHHVAAVYDHNASAMLIYVDGIEQASQSVTGTPKPSEGVPLYLGRYHDGRERFHGVMDELRVWSRALSEAELLARYGEHVSAFGPDSVAPTPATLPEGVPMGMGLEDVRTEAGLLRVATTGARFTLRDGALSCSQRIPFTRDTVRIVLEQETGPFELDGRTDFACRLRSEALNLTFHGDSLLILRAKRAQEVGFRGLFEPEYHAELQGKHLFIDQAGGFGIYPVRQLNSSPPDFSARPWAVTYSLRRGDEVWVSVFPPRPYNYERSFESLAHEGLRDPGFWYPSDKLIDATARHCKVLAIHSYIFPGGEKPPWRIPRFHPADIGKWHEVRQKIQSRGMRVVPYFSPFYYDGSLELTEGGEQRTYFDEVRHAIDVLKVDGLYFDGVSMDFRKSYHVMRKARQMIGDDRILYVHCSTDPLGKAGIYCPFIDTYADYILRGEAGRADLDRDTFLRWVVSSYNIGNGVGIWCYYGSTGASGYRNIVPRSEDIDAALRLHARLWRQGMAWEKSEAGKLEDFDREYYGKLEQLRREHEQRME